jgi:hypothetical protein
MPERMRVVRATEELIRPDIPPGLLWCQEAPRPEARRRFKRRVGSSNNGAGKYHLLLRTIPEDIETLAERESRGLTNTSWFNTQVMVVCHGRSQQHRKHARCVSLFQHHTKRVPHHSHACMPCLAA